MSASDILHPDGSDYDAFLQAEVGEDRTGAAVTVVSALARIGLEPWTEAKELALLSKENAEIRLNAHLEAITDVPALALASESKATKLVALLPHRGSFPFVGESQSGSFSFPRVSAFWVLSVFVVIAVIARVFYLAQVG
ncbi:hypothetical protein [uncultured Tateyamaria sp.]|uniref:hypothetical protein n=1 Tax=uncultured Tateyamaria sp. TaxID=455651 RepID=UPI0026389D7F|nr:hypothetical protein [uncultured Tateyamaria sp.]